MDLEIPRFLRRNYGVIFYQGPSALDSQPIIGIAIANSSNSKTGPMVQTYIMREDVNPIRAVEWAKDFSVCGECPHRGLGVKQRSCYVNLFWGPSGVYKAYKRGNYSEGKLLKGQLIRMGTYGDPAAIPFEVWEGIMRDAEGWTGYTHQWRTCDPRFRKCCMASVDTLEEQEEAQAKFWRTFRVKTPEEPVLKSEAVCPASKEGGRKLQCSTCLACDGFRRGLRGNVVIQIHGATKTFLQGDLFGG